MSANSLDTKAILIRLAIGLPGNVRKDKVLTAEVVSSHNLTKEAGRWVKQVYPDYALAPLTKISTDARLFHYKHTLPWTDEGARILPVANIFTYTDGMRKLKAQFDAAVETFCSNYDKYVEWAKTAHNGSFRAEDYPGADVIRAKFYFDTQESPVPSGKDFRIELQRDELRAMADSVNSRVKEAVEQAKKDLGQRLAEPIKHLSARLKEANGKANARLHASMISNIAEIIEVLPALNVAGDKQILKIAKEAKESLLGVNVETLRENEQYRAETAAKADEIANKLAGYFN